MATIEVRNSDVQITKYITLPFLKKKIYAHVHIKVWRAHAKPFIAVIFERRDNEELSLSTAVSKSLQFTNRSRSISTCLIFSSLCLWYLYQRFISTWFGRLLSACNALLKLLGPILLIHLGKKYCRPSLGPEFEWDTSSRLLQHSVRVWSIKARKTQQDPSFTCLNPPLDSSFLKEESVRFFLCVLFLLLALVTLTPSDA